MQFPEQPQKLQLANRNPAAVHNPQLTPPAAGLDIGDIYFTLFRHKWKILICSAFGLAAAIGLYKLRPPPYQSEAKLFIRYVMDSRAAGPAGDDARVKSIDSHGETIISSELEIMTSLDLVGQVVDTIGADKVIPAVGDGRDRARAIAAIASNLSAEAALHSSVVHLSFRNPNPTVVQPVLREIIEQYLKKHVEIHRALGITGDFLTQETDRLRTRLAQTHEELRSAENKVGVASIEEAKKTYADQISKLRQEIYTAEAEFAERSVMFKELTGKSAHVEETEKPSPSPLPSQDQIDEYRKINERLNLLKHKEQELLTQFTEENSRVKELRVQLDDTTKAKQKIEEETPGLKSFEVARPTPNPATPAVAAIDITGESAHLKALETKIQTFHTQLDALRAEAAKVSEMEATIQELRRRKDLEEANYKYYSASLEQARIDEAMGAGHVSNISEIQSPSPPTRDRSKSLKIMVMLAGGGIAAGLAWAFAIEMLFDRTVKRPVDVERISKLPLFISIPRISSRARRRFAKQQSLALTAIEKADDAKKGTSPAIASQPVYKAPPQLLYHFHETLRDRLIAYFESINLTHKPKLVAVTGLARRSGVTTVAAGLAQCLSETGEGNVLLVDMTAGHGSAQQFFKGQKVCGLDELLHTRNNALIQEKLYVVQESSNSENLSRNLPQRFTKLVPQLKASDFDYIIFDMPPVSQISVTPRLASFMDMVLMVVESEKTNRDVVERASALLAQSKTNVGAVLNKTRSYVPKALYHDSLSET